MQTHCLKNDLNMNANKQSIMLIATSVLVWNYRNVHGISITICKICIFQKITNAQINFGIFVCSQFKTLLCNAW